MVGGVLSHGLYWGVRERPGRAGEHQRIGCLNDLGGFGGRGGLWFSAHPLLLHALPWEDGGEDISCWGVGAGVERGAWLWAGGLNVKGSHSWTLCWSPGGVVHPARKVFFY